MSVGSNGATEDFQEKLDALKADLESLQSHVRGLAGDIGEVATERMNSALADAMKSVHELTGRVEGWGNDNLSSLRDSVRNQPLAALAISMGAGALIGALLLRR